MHAPVKQDVDALVEKTRTASRRIRVLKEKIQELKDRKTCEEAEDEVKMRVSRIEEAYRSESPIPSASPATPCF